jgi:hypothetical protein
MGYVDDLSINSYAELFYAPGQFNSFHTESNVINPYFGPEAPAVLYKHPLRDATGAWRELVNKGAKNFASNPEWVAGANAANNTFPRQLPFTSYTERPGNMPNDTMFGENALVNAARFPGQDEPTFIMEQPVMFQKVMHHLKRGAPLAILAIFAFILIFM